ALQELLSEYRGFLRYLLSHHSEVKLHFRKTPESRNIEIGYEVKFDGEEKEKYFEVYVKTISRHLRLIRKPAPRPAQAGSTLKRRVDNVAVGAIDVKRTAGLEVLPANAGRPLNFAPNVAVGTPVQSMILPATLLLGEWIREFFAPE